MQKFKKTNKKSITVELLASCTPACTGANCSGETTKTQYSRGGKK